VTILLASFMLAGCAGGVFDNGSVIRNEYANDARFMALVPDLRPAMERVANAEDYRYLCVWGRCRPIPPRIQAVNRSADPLAATFNWYDNVIAINLARLGDQPQWYRRAVLAHEFGHWVLKHQIWRPEDRGLAGLITGKGSGCFNDLPACEIEADAESVRLLTIGWGVPRDEAIEQVHRKRLLTYLSWKGKGPIAGHDPEAELEAFRRTFECTDTTKRTCANGPGTFEAEQPKAEQLPGDHEN